MVDDNAPYYYEEDGLPKGYYADFVAAMAKEEPFTYKFVPVDASSYNENLSKKSIDGFIGATNASSGKNILASKSFYTSNICVLAPKSSNISTLKQIKDNSIAAPADTEEEVFAKYLANRYKGRAVPFLSVREALSDIERMNNQMVAINDAVNGIFADIDTQSSITTEFAKQVDSIAASYDKLSDNCMATGTHIYKIGRYIDTARSDMFRSFSNVTTQDMIRIFQIDHFILMWRVYNNAVGFETLKVTQLNNPDSCKLGKWMKAQTDTRITGSRQFKDLDAAHRQIHKYAVDSWNAKESGNVELALEYFQKCYDAFGVYSNKIEEFKSYMRTIGYTDETEKVTFRK